MQKINCRSYSWLNSKPAKWVLVTAAYVLMYFGIAFLPVYEDAASDLFIPVWINIILLSLTASKVGYSLIFDENRGLLYSLSLVLLPFEVAFFLLYIQCFLWPAILIPVSIAAFAFILYLRSDALYHRFRCHLYSCNVMCAIRASAGRQKPSLCHVRRIVIKRVTAIAAAILLAAPVIRILSLPKPDGAIERAETHMAVGVSGNRILDNIEFLNCFRDKNWYKLSSQKKLDAMQVIADIETAYLGIKPVSVISGELDSEKTAAQYEDWNRTIRVAVSTLEKDVDVDYLVEVVCHECRHAYQNHVIDNGWDSVPERVREDPETVLKWQNNLANYIDIDEDYQGYHMQPIEVDAYDYAWRESEVYYQYMDALENLPER